MRYLSVCSGIEAATVAWHPLGWEAAAYSEIERFPRAVLKHHYPDTPLHGDFTTIQGDEYGPVELLVGGTPCQSFSVAGLRKGMDDPRGNLALAYLALAKRTGARWLVWENVPGVLSSNGGRDFGSFLGGLAELGYGFAYRVLDAQFFGVPQRRRRVFVVGHLGDWRRAAAVLFERHSLSGHSAPSREAGEEPAGTLGARSCRSIGAQDAECGHLLPFTAGSHGTYREGVGTLRAHGGDEDGTGRGTPLVPTVAPSIVANGDAHSGFRDERGLVALYDDPRRFDARGVHGGGEHGELHPPLNCTPGQQLAKVNMAVRRITPREAERLQGFPDDYTRIPWRKKAPEECPDGPRYKALGNSMAVPVMRWIGERIDMVENLDALQESEAA